jgi:hypothetical protein
MDAEACALAGVEQRQAQQALAVAVRPVEEAVAAGFALARLRLHVAARERRAVRVQPHAAEVQVVAAVADQQRVRAQRLDALDAVAGRPAPAVRRRPA